MEALGINPGFLIAQLVNFSLFVVVLYFFAWRRLLSAMDARSERIAKGLEDARVAEQARANAEAEAKKILDGARAEAQSILKKARDEAEERAKPILTAAEKAAEEIRLSAEARAEEARNAALGQVRGQVVTLAMAAANRLIGASMDKNQQEKIVNEFFSTTSAEVKGLSGELSVTTALPLDEAEKSRLQGQLGGTVKHWNVDPNILGGVIVRAGDRVIDGSVRARLSALSASLN